MGFYLPFSSVYPFFKGALTELCCNTLKSQKAKINIQAYIKRNLLKISKLDDATEFLGSHDADCSTLETQQRKGKIR